MLASPLKQSEWKNSLGNAQISLNMVAVMFLPSHNKPKTPTFLLCAILYCHFNHISTNSNLYCYTIAMCNAFSGCVYSGFLITGCEQVMMSARDLRPKSRWAKYVSVQCLRAPLCALVTLSPIPRHTHIRPSIPHRLIKLKRWPLHNVIYHSSRCCDLGFAYAEASVGMETTLGLKG